MTRLKWFFVLVGFVSALAVPATASASSVTSSSAELRQGAQVVTQVEAGSHGGVAIFLTPTIALGSGDTVTITGPEGTDFSNLAGSNFNTMTNVTTNSGASSFAPAFSDGGRTVTGQLPNGVVNGVAAGQQLEVSLASYQNLITFGTVSGPNSFQVSTIKDTTPVATTPSYTTDPGGPTSVIAVDGPQRTPVNQLFDSMKVEVQDQYGNPVPGQEVDVSAPASDLVASGTFPAGDFNATITTGLDGQATMQRIKANGVTGDWDLDLQGPNSTSATYDMTNLVHGDPSEVHLTLAPLSVPADGSSSVEATATVTDRYGIPIPGELVVFTSDGSQQVSGTIDNGDGTYSAGITASTKAGPSTITATVGSGGDDIIGQATLTQTALPAKTINLTLSPTSVPADGKSITKAKAVVKDALGNTVTGVPVTVTSDGRQKIGAVKASGQGVYTATVTAGKVAGSSQITASVTGSSPAVSAGTTLTQTALPVPPMVVKPKLRFVHPPKKKVRKAKVKFRFKVVKGEASGFQCRLDRKKWSKCKSPRKVKLKRGKHVFKVRGIAKDGSFGKPIVRKVKRVKKHH